jgi:hypothetical protein
MTHQQRAKLLALTGIRIVDIEMPHLCSIAQFLASLPSSPLGVLRFSRHLFVQLVLRNFISFKNFATYSQSLCSDFWLPMACLALKIDRCDCPNLLFLVLCAIVSRRCWCRKTTLSNISYLLSDCV